MEALTSLMPSLEKGLEAYLIFDAENVEFIYVNQNLFQVACISDFQCLSPYQLAILNLS